MENKYLLVSYNIEKNEYDYTIMNGRQILNKYEFQDLDYSNRIVEIYLLKGVRKYKIRIKSERVSYESGSHYLYITIGKSKINDDGEEEPNIIDSLYFTSDH